MRPTREKTHREELQDAAIKSISKGGLEEFRRHIQEMPYFIEYQNSWSSSMKASTFTAMTTAIGGFLGGPIGMAFGAFLGGTTAVNAFTPSTNTFKEMTSEEKQRLVMHVMQYLGNEIICMSDKDLNTLIKDGVKNKWMEPAVRSYFNTSANK